MKNVNAGQKPALQQKAKGGRMLPPFCFFGDERRHGKKSRKIA
jgi:hypothetical protein